jgi:Carboxypeptidase regulatory-like domain
MRNLVLACLVAGGLQAAVIRGTVVEHQTGRPLSRVSVLLEPVPGSGGTRKTTHTDRFGFFEFAGEPAGYYMLQASRAPFLTALYGQKRWNSAGMPLLLTEIDIPFVTLQMLRFGAISGTVVDENEIGMPEFEVAAYLNTRPPQFAAKATSDEQGRYRIYGLLPGNYIVRTASKQVEDEGYKPTYGRETELFDQARAVDVEIEQQVNLANVRPLPGKLFSLTAEVIAMDPGMPATLTFASEMGRQIIHGQGPEVSRVFPGLAPGDYEVFGEAPSDAPPIQGDFQRLSLGRDSSVSLPIKKVSMVAFAFDGAPQQAARDGTLKLLARRKDLAGTYDNRTITGTSAALAPGRWELALSPLDGYYASDFSGPGNYGFRRNQRGDGWNEVTITTRPGAVRFTVSKNVSSVHGIVKDNGEPVIGAPVFLEPMDLEPAKRLTFAYVALTDTHGVYRFASMPPGRYRLLSTFEYQMPDAKIMVNAGAKELQLETRSDAARDLELYVIR